MRLVAADSGMLGLGSRLAGVQAPDVDLSQHYCGVGSAESLWSQPSMQGCSSSLFRAIW